MSLERKDVRAKLDPEIHEALVKICERDGLDIGEYIEREVAAAVKAELHKYMLSRSKFEGLGLLGNLSGKPGKGALEAKPWDVETRELCQA
jgi:hypothetical protein